MSYILDALRKSDQQRHHGATPTLTTTPAAPLAESGQVARLAYGMLAIVLLGAGILIGWLRPWQPAEPAVASMAAKAPDYRPPDLAAAVAIATPPAAPDMPAQSLQPRKTIAPAPATVGPAAAQPVKQGTPQDVIAMEDLPLSIRQELPDMAISLHAYSRKPRDRLVSINNQLLHEGDSPAPGIALERITPAGMVFSYKGLRFSRGVQ